MGMSRKPDYSKKIIKILGQKTAISMPELKEQINCQVDLKSPKYAITRSLKGLREAGLIQQISSGQNDYTLLTKEGKKKMHSLQLDPFVR